MVGDREKKSSNVFSSFYAAINCVFYLQDNSSPGDKEGLGRYRQNCQENCPHLRVWWRRGGEGAEEAGGVGGGAGTEKRRHLLRERRVVMLSLLSEGRSVVCTEYRVLRENLNV